MCFLKTARCVGPLIASCRACRWLFLLCCTLGLPDEIPAQFSNEAIFQRLLAPVVIQNGPFSKLEAPWLRGISLPAADSSARRSLEIRQPEVQYRRIGGELYRRSLRLQLLVTENSISQGLSPVFEDTLSLVQLRAIRRASPPALRGDLPTAGARIWRPAALIAGSAALVVSLFYLRSR